MSSARRRMRLKYHGDRKRGNIYTGRPGAPKWASEGKRRTNNHDHSATANKRKQGYACACPFCRTEQPVAYGATNACKKCQAKI